jgi:hypothetical protein
MTLPMEGHRDHELYADTHVRYNRFTGRVSTKQDGIAGKCLENWWAEHNWEGYYE